MERGSAHANASANAARRSLQPTHRHATTTWGRRNLAFSTACIGPSARHLHLADAKAGRQLTNSRSHLRRAAHADKPEPAGIRSRNKSQSQPEPAQAQCGPGPELDLDLTHATRSWPLFKQSAEMRWRRRVVLAVGRIHESHRSFRRRAQKHAPLVPVLVPMQCWCSTGAASDTRPTRTNAYHVRLRVSAIRPEASPRRRTLCRRRYRHRRTVPGDRFNSGHAAGEPSTTQPLVSSL